MHNLAHFYAAKPTAADRQTRMLEEIAYLEARLRDIGGNGDCAYEKSLERSYRSLISERRQLLAEGYSRQPG
jgi:hypothetical protein